MKFPVNKCMSCGLDLTTAEPAEVKCVGEAEVGTCPQCLTPYFMVEDNALPLDPPPEPEPAPAPPKAKGRRGASEPEPVVEPEAPPAEPVKEVPPPEPEAGEAEPEPEE